MNFLEWLVKQSEDPLASYDAEWPDALAKR